METKNIYELVTDEIIGQLENGIIPWHIPWSKAGIPKNLLTNKPYRGVNVLLLAMLGFKRNYFLTFEQVQYVGGSVKKGEKSQIVIFWKWDTAKSSKKPPKPILTYYRVFNISQCVNIPTELLKPIDTCSEFSFEACDMILSQMPNSPKIEHWENIAYYNPSLDLINVPDIEYFADSQMYYVLLFQKLVQSTGHKTRLNRKGIVGYSAYKEDAYSQEVLISEIGAWYIQSLTGLSSVCMSITEKDIEGWMKKLQEDVKCMTYACTLAEKATDYILNIRRSNNENTITNTSKKVEYA